MIPVVLWGASGQAKVIREALDPSVYQIVGVFDREAGMVSPFQEVPIYHGEDGFKAWLAQSDRPKECWGVAAIGGARGADRLMIQKMFKAAGMNILTVVHPRAFVAQDASLGEGCQVLAQAAVGASARLGAACIVNTGATVDHECVLEDGVHVCPGAHLAGCVDVGESVMIGTGAVILPRLKIGKGAIIGAGAVVLKDVEPGAVVAGNPARPLSKGEES